MPRHSRLRRHRPGDHLSAAEFNDLLSASRGGLRWAAPPLHFDPSTSTLSLDRFEPFWAKITGRLGTAYSWAEQRWNGTAFATLTGGRSGTTSVHPAYEVNLSTTVVTNSIVLLYPGYQGNQDYRFAAIKLKSPCPGEVCVSVRGCCNYLLPSASVTIKQGVTTIGTCTTATNGTKCCVPTATSGSYTAEATKATFSGTASATVLVGCTTTNTTLTLTTPADAAHVCTCCCADPMPISLSMSDNDGTHALTWDTSAAATEGNVWFGVHTHTFPSGYTTGPYGGCVFGGAVTGWLAWVVRSYGGQCLATLYYPICRDGQVGPTDTVAAPANMLALRNMITFYPYQALADGYSGFTSAVGGSNCVLGCAPSACYYRAAAGAPGFAGSLATLST
jgi:hypothetical protein